jgi:hypothetical protein
MTFPVESEERSDAPISPLPRHCAARSAVAFPSGVSVSQKTPEIMNSFPQNE